MPMTNYPFKWTREIPNPLDWVRAKPSLAGSVRSGDLTIGSVLSAIGPMVMVELLLVLILLLLDAQSGGSIGRALDIRTVRALAASTIVFPAALYPLVRWLTSWGSQELAAAADSNLRRKLGFALSDFSDDGGLHLFQRRASLW